MTKPSILCLAADAYGGQGGISQYVRDVIGALLKSDTDYDITFLSRFSSPDTASSSSELPKTMRQRHCQGSRWRFALYSAAAAKRRRIRYILCFHVHYLPLALLLARWRRVPLVLFTYGIDVWQLRNRLLLWCVNGAQLIITISRFTRVALIHGCGVPAHRIRVLPNCIDQSTTHGEARHIDEINARFTLPGKKVLLTVGRLSAKERYKGHDRVIRQLAKLILRIPNVCYLIVGDGDDRLRLEALVEQLAVSEYVVFAGELDSDWLQAMYARADVFTMPSTGEGFGFVYLEAMSAGLPIVALDAAGTPDALAHSEDSYLVAADDDDALLDALTVCLCRTSHRQRAPRTAAIAPFSRKRFTVQLGTIMATVPPIV